MDGAMGKYFVFPPKSERESSVAFAASDALLFVNVDKRGRPKMSFGSISEKSTTGSMRWHRIKWLVDPLMNETSLQTGPMPRDERELKRSAMSLHLSYSHVSSCKIDNNSYLMSSLSDEDYDNQVRQAKIYNCQPVEMFDGSILWKHLADFYEINDPACTFIVGCGNKIVIAGYENRQLTLFQQFSFNQDEGELRDLLLTELVPFLHHRHIIDDLSSIYLMKFSSSFNELFIEELALDVDIKSMNIKEEKSFHDVLLKVCSKYVLSDEHVAYQKRLNLPIFSFYLWFLMLIGILGYQFNQWHTIKLEENVLRQSILQAGDVQEVKPIYKAFIRDHVKQSRSFDYNELITWLSVSIPKNIWLTNMYLSPLENTFLFTGYTREINEPYILRDDISNILGISDNELKLEYKAGAEYLIKIKTKKKAYTGALGRSQKEIQAKKQQSHILAQYFELTHGNLNSIKASKLTKPSSQSNQVFDQWWK